MSVTGGGDFSHRLNVAGRPARIISGPEPEKWLIDYGGGASGSQNEAVTDMAAFSGIFGSYDDVAVIVYQVMVHVEGYQGADFISTEFRRNDIDNPSRTQGELETGAAAGWFYLYTGASEFDSGSADAGNQGDGHQWEHEWSVPASSPHQYLFHLTEDDSITIQVGSDGSNDVSPLWRLLGAVVEFEG